MAEYKPDDLSYWDEECSKAAKDYAEYVYQEKLFQVLSAGKFATLVMFQRSLFPNESNVSLETRAKASQDWKEFVNEQVELLKEAGRSWIHYEDCRRKWETAQSIMAYKREEFKRIG